MPESLIPITPGSGAKNARTFNRTIGVNSVEEQVGFLAEYSGGGSSGSPTTEEFETPPISYPTGAPGHLLEGLNLTRSTVLIRWIGIFQVGVASVAATDRLSVVSIFQVGSGFGTSAFGAPYDTADGSSMGWYWGFAPTPPLVEYGPEVATEAEFDCQYISAIGAQSPGMRAPLIGELDFEKVRGKSLRVWHRTGIAVRFDTQRAGATVIVAVRYTTWTGY